MPHLGLLVLWTLETIFTYDIDPHELRWSNDLSFSTDYSQLGSRKVLVQGDYIVASAESKQEGDRPRHTTKESHYVFHHEDSSSKPPDYASGKNSQGDSTAQHHPPVDDIVYPTRAPYDRHPLKPPHQRARKQPGNTRSVRQFLSR